MSDSAILWFEKVGIADVPAVRVRHGRASLRVFTAGHGQFAGKPRAVTARFEYELD